MRAGFVSQLWPSGFSIRAWEYGNCTEIPLPRVYSVRIFINAAESDTMKEVQLCGTGNLAYVEIFFDHFSPRRI